ncbi:histone deacetylase family protein [Amaricoccus solimangrovi]|uniref:Histone deacetylase family protein n=1 Tax=Amaricoccus solimangrovi TaxID=2589815 RepID=A0A501WUU1_9RHOB|nr:histone deacetylase family protein [Amaricoccus solimangrovi]TPE53178.1 histone deacetylase family protein [Amaricoccus solimangrovi]
MTTALITHGDCLGHVNPPGHPEQVERLRRVLGALEGEEFAYLLRVEAPLVTDEQILRAHPESYLADLVARDPVQGYSVIDGDTFLGPGSLTAARRGAGAVVAGVDMVLGGEARNAFCAIRPPGHHAEKTTAMGFCFLGNVAIAALHALEAHGLSRVGIVDFDVHHGNGTQDVLWNEPRIFFGSSQQMPLFPGTGSSDETGAHGQICNMPLPAGASGQVFRAGMLAKILPALDAFAPELILVSAGFDAHHRDPLANLNLADSDFAWITSRICDIADRHCEGRVVSTLEGGYDLAALASAAAAHVRVLMERGYG